MIILGIDNGLDGGLVALTGEGYPEFRLVMPTIKVKDKEGKRVYNIAEIVKFVKKVNPGLTILEVSQPFSKQGVTSTFCTGMGYGIMQGLLTALNCSFTCVRPKAWQKVMFEGLPKTDTKEMSLTVCNKLWPGIDWRASERCRVAHDGLNDAAMLAEYERRRVLTGEPNA